MTIEVSFYGKILWLVPVNLGQLRRMLVYRHAGLGRFHCINMYTSMYVCMYVILLAVKKLETLTLSSIGCFNLMNVGKMFLHCPEFVQ